MRRIDVVLKKKERHVRNLVRVGALVAWCCHCGAAVTRDERAPREAEVKPAPTGAAKAFVAHEIASWRRWLAEDALDRVVRDERPWAEHPRDAAAAQCEKTSGEGDSAERLYQLADACAEAQAATRLALPQSDADAARIAQASVHWSERASQLFDRLARQHAAFPRIDDVLYFHALSLERATYPGKPQPRASARAAALFDKLIREHQKSRHVPLAYLALARQARQDASQRSRASAWLAKAAEAPKNRAAAYIQLELADLLYADADDPTTQAKPALAAAVRAIELERQQPALPGRGEVSRRAFESIHLIYPDAERAEHAQAFFTKLAPADDVPQHLAAVAQMYIAADRFREALVPTLAVARSRKPGLACQAAHELALREDELSAFAQQLAELQQRMEKVCAKLPHPP